MSIAGMRFFIKIVSAVSEKDAQGFSRNDYTILANIRAYKEERHGNQSWKNRAAFSQATCLFRFRKIPGVEVDTTHFILCGDDRYNIISVEDVRGRGMYIEVLADKVIPSVR